MAGDVSVGKGDGGGKNTLDSRLSLPCIDGHCHLFGASLSTAEKFHDWSQEGQVVIVKYGTGGKERKTYPAPVKVKAWKVVSAMGMAAEGFEHYTLKVRAVAEMKETIWPPTVDSEGYYDLGKGGHGTVLDLGLGRSDGTLPGIGDWQGGMAHAIGNDGTNANVCLEGNPKPSNRACVSLLLDLGYTGLPTPNLNAVLWAAGLTPRCMPDPDGFYVPDKSFFWGKRAGFQFTIEALADVAARFPGEVWPFVPFDPRRAVCPPPGEPRSALDVVKFAINELGFAGVKLYSRCGWMPLNNSLFYPDKGAKLDEACRSLYRYLVSEDLPVLNHTSPTGFPPAGMLDLPARYAHGHPDIPSMPSSIRSADYTGTQSANQWAEAAAWAACTSAANYVHYVQNSVSPYAWEPVLKEFPKLRLCFAHSGGRVSAVAKFVESGFDSPLWDEIKKDWGPKASTWSTKKEDWSVDAGGAMYDLYNNPQVASGKWFKDELFRQCCIQYADLLLNCKDPLLKPDWSSVTLNGGKPAMAFYGHKESTFLGFHVGEQTDMFVLSRKDVRDRVIKEIDGLVRGAFAPWLAKWAATYPLDWYSKIIELYKNSSYPNLYSDIAYYAGEYADDQASVGVQKHWFQRLLEPFVAHARQDKVVAQKTIFGTDWWMTEMDHLGPKEFWNWVAEKVDMKSPMWEQWTTTNTLKYLNLGKRVDSMEKWYKKNNPKVVLPGWWANLKPFYDQQSQG